MKQLFWISFFLMTLFNGCKPCEKTPLPKDNDCKTIGFVRDYSGLDGCSLLIVLENGDKLIPVEISDKNFKMRDGQKIQFGYKEKPIANVCMAGKTVVITCIKEIPVTNCDNKELIKLGFPDFETYSASLQPGFTIIEYSSSKGKLHLKIGYSGCSPDRNFSFITSPFISKSLPPQRDCKLLFEPQLCEAYFTRNLCFDMSSLDQPTILVLSDQNQTYRIRVEP